MVSFTSLVLGAVAFAGALAMPNAQPSNGTALFTRAGTGSSTGTNNGYYYQFWTNNQGDVIYTNMAGGKYEVQWSGEGDFTAGKGWNPGTYGRVINYNAQYYPGNKGGGGSLAVYGWSTNPLVEYYIMENYPSPPTSGLTFVGTVSSDGSNYNIYKHQQVNQPSIQGTSTFWQYISIRQSPRSSGSINTGTHFNAWKSHGLNLGQLNYQIVSTEAYGGGEGASTVTVS